MSYLHYSSNLNCSFLLITHTRDLDHSSTMLNLYSPLLTCNPSVMRFLHHTTAPHQPSTTCLTPSSSTPLLRPLILPTPHHWSPPASVGHCWSLPPSNTRLHQPHEWLMWRRRLRAAPYRISTRMSMTPAPPAAMSKVRWRSSALELFASAQILAAPQPALHTTQVRSMPPFLPSRPHRLCEIDAPIPTESSTPQVSPSVRSHEIDAPTLVEPFDVVILPVACFSRLLIRPMARSLPVVCFSRFEAKCWWTRMMVRSLFPAVPTGGDEAWRYKSKKDELKRKACKADRRNHHRSYSLGGRKCSRGATVTPKAETSTEAWVSTEALEMAMNGGK
ncbi:hypothetical protein GUJ93_ZPchr0003g17925 [Zizania palustris]|uniref:Uncharacterized protein n=1 Tax=Zizania palustris TaxID=103762 RepID=A0A8J5STV4_ZIZPA|nr:hypothetical protein GUJ93_ZPchr0003g17925 [Zizania palustris]